MALAINIRQQLEEVVNRLRFAFVLDGQAKINVRFKVLSMDIQYAQCLRFKCKHTHNLVVECRAHFENLVCKQLRIYAVGESAVMYSCLSDKVCDAIMYLASSSRDNMPF